MRKDGGCEGRLAVCKTMFVPQYQKVIIEKTVQFYLFSSKLAQTNDQTSVAALGEQEPGSASIVLSAPNVSE